MQKFSIHLTERQLTLKRDNTKEIWSCIGVSGATAGLISFFLFPLPGHIHVPLGERLALFPALVVCTGFLGRLYFVLRRQELVFDRVLGQVVVNGQPVHPLAELQSVCLERSFYSEGSSVKLYLRMKSRVKMEIVSDGVFGVSEREMRSLAETLAEFAHVNLITPDEFIPATSQRPTSPTMPKKWGRKGFRKPLSRNAGDGSA